MTRSENTILTLNLNLGANITYRRKLTELLQTLRKSAGRKQGLTRVSDMTSLEVHFDFEYIEFHRRIVIFSFLLSTPLVQLKVYMLITYKCSGEHRKLGMAHRLTLVHYKFRFKSLS